MNQAASGEAQMAAAGPTLLLWAAGLVFGVGAWFGLRTVRPSRVAVIAFATVCMVGFTLWTIRPAAPTGGDHAEALGEGNDIATDGLSSVLDETLRGRWRVRSVRDPYPCRDWLGRTRGAALIETTLEIVPHMRLVELDQLTGQLMNAGWVVDTEQVTYQGREGRYIDAVRNGYTIRVGTVYDDVIPTPYGDVYDEDEITLSTPCLRSE